MDDELGAFFAEIDALDPNAAAAKAKSAKQETAAVKAKAPPATARAPAAAVAVAAVAAPPQSASLPPAVAAAAAVPRALPTQPAEDASPVDAPAARTGGGATWHAAAGGAAAGGAAGVPPQRVPPQLLAAAANQAPTEPKLPVLRTAAGQKWKDAELAKWPDDDFRIFVGSIGNDVTDDLLTRTFQHYASFNRARVVRDKKTEKSRGYGFVSFANSKDYVAALTDMQGKYCGNRPMVLSKATTSDRNDTEAIAKREAWLERKRADGGQPQHARLPQSKRRKKNWWD